ncbi:DUF3515 family protein [Streptomyces sp. M19]
MITAGTEHYNPKAQGAVVNGVEWLPEEQSDDSYRFTTVLRKAYVEVTVPGKYAPDQINPLLDLAKAVRKNVPEGVV